MLTYYYLQFPQNIVNQELTHNLFTMNYDIKQNRHDSRLVNIIPDVTMRCDIIVSRYSIVRSGAAIVVAVVVDS